MVYIIGSFLGALVNSTKYTKTFPLRRDCDHGEQDEFINIFKFSRLVGLRQILLVPNILNNQVLLMINGLLKDTLPDSVKVSSFKASRVRREHICMFRHLLCVLNTNISAGCGYRCNNAHFSPHPSVMMAVVKQD